jgi:hypothetical protein
MWLTLSISWFDSDRVEQIALRPDRCAQHLTDNERACTVPRFRGFVVFDSAYRQGASIAIEEAHAFDGIRGFGTAGGMSFEKCRDGYFERLFYKIEKSLSSAWQRL